MPTPANASAAYKAQIEAIGQTKHLCILKDHAVTGQTIPTSAFTQVSYTGGSALVDTDSMADIANSRINVPASATYVNITGHLSFAQQSVADAYCSIHLWRNGKATTEDLLLHNRMYFPMGAPVYISLFATSGWIPLVSAGVAETWELRAWQNTGNDVLLSASPGSSATNWLNVQYV